MRWPSPRKLYNIINIVFWTNYGWGLFIFEVHRSIIDWSLNGLELVWEQLWHHKLPEDTQSSIFQAKPLPCHKLSSMLSTGSIYRMMLHKVISFFQCRIQNLQILFWYLLRPPITTLKSVDFSCNFVNLLPKVDTRYFPKDFYKPCTFCLFPTTFHHLPSLKRI